MDGLGRFLAWALPRGVGGFSDPSNFGRRLESIAYFQSAGTHVTELLHMPVTLGELPEGFCSGASPKGFGNKAVAPERPRRRQAGH